MFLQWLNDSMIQSLDAFLRFSQHRPILKARFWAWREPR